MGSSEGLFFFGQTEHEELRAMDPNRPMTAEEAALEAVRLQKPPHDPEADKRQIIAAELRLAGERTGQTEPANEAAEAVQRGEPTETPGADSSQAMPAWPEEADVATSNIDDLQDSAQSDAPSPADVADIPAAADQDPFDTTEPIPVVGVDAEESAFDEAPSVLPPAADASAEAFAEAVGQAPMPELIKPADEWSWLDPPSIDPFGADAPGLGATDAPFDRAPFDAPIWPKSSADKPVIRDQLMRPGDEGSIQRGPYIPSQDIGSLRVQLLADRTNADAEESRETFAPGELQSARQSDGTGTVDKNSSLMSPVVLVSLANTETIFEAELDSAAKRIAALVRQIAEFVINDEFHRRDSELRAIWQDYM
jgi:hypothetical protein